MSVPSAILSAKVLAAATLVVAGTMFWVGALSAAEGPALPPAIYKPLPVGTTITYSDRSYIVTRVEGFESVLETNKNKGSRAFLNAYALFGEFADNLYAHGSASRDFLTYQIDGDNRKELEAFWPLVVGKKTSFKLEEVGNQDAEGRHRWQITLATTKTEVIVLDGYEYATYVIEERGEVEYGSRYVGRKWYHPPSGLVIRAMRKWEKTGVTFGSASNYKISNFAEGETEYYYLVDVAYPVGTTTHVLGRSKVGGAPDEALLAEVERLKQEAEKVRKAGEARKAREAEEEKARATEIARLKREIEEKKASTAQLTEQESKEMEARVAEIARLKREAEERRNADETRKALEAEVARAREVEIAGLKRKAEETEKARESEIARLKQEIEVQRRDEESRKVREGKAEKARVEEIARLRQDVEERRKEEARLTKTESRELEAREAEMARLRREAEEARRAIEVRKAREAEAQMAREAEIAKLKQESDHALKARETEIARLRQTLAERRDDKTSDAESSFNDVEFGRYHALVIGIDNYQHLPKLQTAANDARAVAEILKRDYGFNVTLLIDPGRREIVNTLDIFREKLGPKDNLLIYYAGHGWLDKDVDRGYWLPIDAEPKRRSEWVSNSTITDTLKALGAKHVMVVADSCYSGTLVRSADVGVRTRTGDYWKRMAEKWARVAITSGGLEPVVDSAGGGHSPFAKAFIEVLRDNASVMDGTQLFSHMRRPVMVAAQQTPQYADVREAGHDGGDFLFVRKK